MKFLLLNGGGLDSLAVAKLARQQYPDSRIESVYFGYGSPSEPKTSAGARAIAEAYCDKHDHYNMCKNENGVITPLSNMLVPLNQDFWGIPFWGAWLLVNGYVQATHRGMDVLLSGIWGDGYRPEINVYLEKFMACSKITPKRVVHEAPLFGIDRELVNEIVKDDPIVGKTWSCNSLTACGKCRKCLFRKLFDIKHDGE
jgi:7-cyano-7-deazaguanine synthase in queuosine biosynthesis